VTGHFKILRININLRHNAEEDAINEIKSKAAPETMKITWLPACDPGAIYVYCIIEWCEY
jgi:hypothetical protein